MGKLARYPSVRTRVHAREELPARIASGLPNQKNCANPETVNVNNSSKALKIVYGLAMENPPATQCQRPPIRLNPKPKAGAWLCPGGNRRTEIVVGLEIGEGCFERTPLAAAAGDLRRSPGLH